MVFVFIGGVLNGEPVPIAVPPVGTSYHFNDVPVPVAASCTDTGPGPHAEPGVVPVTCGLLSATEASFEVTLFPLQLAINL